MFYRLEIENFYSIREKQIVDLRASDSVPEEEAHLTPAWRGSSERVPKVVAIFGPNASGKSTVLKAVSFLSTFVTQSFKADPNSRMPYERFANAEWLSRPTHMAIELGGVSDVKNLANPNAEQCRYRYELDIGGPSDEPQRVLGERLFYWPAPHRHKVKLFERAEDGRVSASKAFGMAGFTRPLELVLRSNASVISTLNQLKHPFASALWNAAASVSGNILMERTESADEQSVQWYSNNPGSLTELNRELPAVDLGIREVRVVQGPNGPMFEFEHKALTFPLPLRLESHGTKSFVKTYPFIAYALAAGGVALLDELDASLHPTLLPEIVRWFRDENRNTQQAQLWMTCHNASLLEHLSKEEVIFCEKDYTGSTSVYSLSDVAGVRRSENFYRKYLSGAYGALPNLG